MYQRKLEKDIRCPLEYGLEIFGGKWNSRIICVLAAKKVLRYSELRKEMGNITDAVLASSLKELIRKKDFRLYRFCRASASGRDISTRKTATTL